jgi:hypothetical protein
MNTPNTANAMRRTPEPARGCRRGRTSPPKDGIGLGGPYGVPEPKSAPYGGGTAGAAGGGGMRGLGDVIPGFSL